MNILFLSKNNEILNMLNKNYHVYVKPEDSKNFHIIIYDIYSKDILETVNRTIRVNNIIFIGNVNDCINENHIMTHFITLPVMPQLLKRTIDLIVLNTVTKRRTNALNRFVYDTLNKHILNLGVGGNRINFFYLKQIEFFIKIILPHDTLEEIIKYTTQYLGHFNTTMLINNNLQIQNIPVTCLDVIKILILLTCKSCAYLDECSIEIFNTNNIFYLTVNADINLVGYEDYKQILQKVLLDNRIHITKTLNITKLTYNFIEETFND